MTTAGSRSSYRHFAVVSDEFASPKILCCPADKERSGALNFSSDALEGFLGGKNRALSYWFSAHASASRPSGTLAGDRHIKGNIGLGCNVSGTDGLLVRLTLDDDRWGWDASMHNNSGNILMLDGSVQSLSSPAMKRFLAEPGNISCLLKPDP